MTDDHLLSWYLAYTYGLFVLVCSRVGFQRACPCLVPSYMFPIGIDG